MDKAFFYIPASSLAMPHPKPNHPNCVNSAEVSTVAEDRMNGKPKALEWFSWENTRFIVGFRSGRFGSCILKGFMKYCHNMSFTSHRLPTLPSHVSPQVKSLYTTHPTPPLALDAVVTHSACKEISGFTGTMLMGLPTNT